LLITNTAALTLARARLDISWQIIMKPPSPAITQGRLPDPSATPSAQPVSWPSEPQAGCPTKLSRGRPNRLPNT
jgi:hypothetical protein